MGYALFAQRKVVLDGRLNAAQLQQTQKSNEQYLLATESLGLSQQMTSQTAAQSGELAELYKKLSETESSSGRDSINNLIQQKQQEFKQENAAIDAQIYEVSAKEAAIEMEVKRLDTMVTALQQQLEAVEQAEGQAIKNATPKYNGVG